MDRVFHTDWSGEDGHPAEDDLLLYIDGELETKEAVNLRSHLEACWSCRVRAEKIQEAISSFIDYRNQVLTRIIEPPQSWRGFDAKLSRLTSESRQRSLFYEWFGRLGRHLFIVRAHLKAQLSLRTAVRLTIIFFLAFIIVGLVMRFNRGSAVSANELLQHATEAQVDEIRRTNQAVIYQKLRLHRAASAAAQQDSINIEIWNDTTSARVRRSIEDENGRRFIRGADLTAATRDSSPPILLELEKALLDNHLDAQKLLSPVSYRVWRNSIVQKQEQVTKSHLTNGLEVLTLRTIPAGPVDAGKIIEAALVVRKADWHPIEQRFRVSSAAGEQVYEIAETAFEVVSLKNLNPAIFGEPSVEPIVASPSHPPAATPKPTTAPSPIAAATPAHSVATPELEVEVLRLLNEVRADLGEQISVERTKDGLLIVSGLVDTEQRKKEIAGALSAITDNPAVRINIQTLAEAVEQQKANAPSHPPSEQTVQIENGSIAAESELRRYFSAMGVPANEINDRIHQLSARFLRHSQQALFHASALKRLVNRFSAGELQAMSNEARAKWFTLVREYARACHGQTSMLKQELRSVFATELPSEDLSGALTINDYASLAQAVERLFELGSTNDKVVRLAFTISTDSTKISAVKTPQFWQSLASAEALAAIIQRAEIRY